MRIEQGGDCVMRKLKVYLDTSVVSYLHQADAPEKMQNTLDLWQLFRNKVYDLYIRYCN